MCCLMSLPMLLLCGNALAVELTKAKTFLSQKKPCKVALASIANNQILGNVYCVWNGVGNEGTVNEFTGCFLGRYNLNTNKYLPLLAAGAGMQGRSQPKGSCTKNLIEDILMKYPSSDWHQLGQNSRPILSELRRDDPSIQVVYDEMNIVTLELLRKADGWQEPKVALKSSKTFDCSDDTWSEEKEAYCLEPSYIEVRCRNGDIKPKYRSIYEANYQRKTGKKLPPCGPPAQE